MRSGSSLCLLSFPVLHVQMHVHVHVHVHVYVQMNMQRVSLLLYASSLCYLLLLFVGLEHPMTIF